MFALQQRNCEWMNENSQSDVLQNLTLVTSPSLSSNFKFSFQIWNNPVWKEESCLSVFIHVLDKRFYDIYYLIYPVLKVYHYLFILSTSSSNLNIVDTYKILLSAWLVCRCFQVYILKLCKLQCYTDYLSYKFEMSWTVTYMRLTIIPIKNLV